MKGESVWLWFKRILLYGWITFLFYLGYEAIFKFPLEQTAWGFSNEYLITVLILLIGTVSFWSMFRINNLQDDLAKLKEEKGGEKKDGQ